MTATVAFIIGVVAGFTVGYLLLALAVAAKDGDQ